MDRSVLLFFISGIVYALLMGQTVAWGNIGNRSYSAWYETHLLVERKGLCKLIYFKPKHFGRYTVYEVLAFFASFLLPLIYTGILILVYKGILQDSIFKAIISLSALFVFIGHFVVVIVNDVGSRKDKKKRFYLETGKREVADVENLFLPVLDNTSKLVNQIALEGLRKRNNTYYTIENLRDSYHTRIQNARNDTKKIDKINREYIEYFKNIETLIVVKENKDGTLVFKTRFN